MRVEVGCESLLSHRNGDLHDRFFDGILFFAPTVQAVKHFLGFEAESGELRGGLGGGVAEYSITVCHKNAVSGEGSSRGGIDCTMGQIDGSWNVSPGIGLGSPRIDYDDSGDSVVEVVVDVGRVSFKR